MTGRASLPIPLIGLSDEAHWFEPPATDAKLVFLPRQFRNDDPSAARKELHRILHVALAEKTSTRFDLIKGHNALDQGLPNVASATFGESERLRGILLENLGAAILPRLTQRELHALEAAGAEVLDNKPFEAPMVEVNGSSDLHPEWHLQRINLEKVENLSGKGVRIGILDTGIDKDHPVFAKTDVQFRVFYPRGSREVDQTPRDFGFHGTHVAGLCAGANGVARDAGLAVAAVLTERIGRKLSCYPAQIAAALNWMLEEVDGKPRRVDVINASLGGPLTQITEYATPLRNTRNAGILTIAAIGNDGEPEGRHLAPAALESVLAVGAVDHDDNIYQGSAWGRAWSTQGYTDKYKPEIVAPGVKITSAAPNNDTKTLTGTSMACPLVTGAAALLLEKTPDLRSEPDMLVERLLSLSYFSSTMGLSGIRERFGVGRLDLAKI